MSDPAASDGTWRISDGDRDAAVQALGEHYATGRLDKAEYDERVDLAWAARTNLELPPLFRTSRCRTATWSRRRSLRVRRRSRARRTAGRRGRPVAGVPSAPWGRCRFW